MTTIQYDRARRIGLITKQIKEGKLQLDVKCEPSIGFKDAFTKSEVSMNVDRHILKSSLLDTPLGPMLAISDEEALYLLEFIDRRDLELKIQKLKIKTKASIIPGVTTPITSIKAELKSYFNSNLKEFKTPIRLLGSAFQKLVWDALITIPYGETRSYQEQALLIGKQFGHRAVANANGINQIFIVIPCHRIINSNGELGGYGGGISRKKWLLDHEKQNR